MKNESWAKPVSRHKKYSFKDRAHVFALSNVRKLRLEMSKMNTSKIIENLEESRSAHDIHHILASGARQLGNTQNDDKRDRIRVVVGVVTPPLFPINISLNPLFPIINVFLCSLFAFPVPLIFRTSPEINTLVPPYDGLISRLNFLSIHTDPYV